MRKKLLALLLGVAAVVCCTIGITACSNETGCKTEWGGMEHIAYKAPTCTKAGNESYDYCPTCKKYWLAPHKRGKEVTPEQMKIPALNHDFQGGKCSRCGKTDPELLPDTLQIPDLAISAEGVFTWGGIKSASKYRVEITDDENVKHVYDITDSEDAALDLTDLSDGYELAYGKNYASITAYKPYSENIDGETIADDIPISESKADFIAIKQNSGYTFTQLTYADEYITINGAYSDVRTDGDKEYILLEQQIDADKQSVKFNLSRKITAAQGVSLSYYKDSECTQSISSTEWQFWSTPAGAADYYIKATGAVNKVYTVRVLAVKPVEVKLIKAEKLASGYNFTTLLSGLTILENDYIDIEMFYSKISSSSLVVVDADFNAYRKTRGQNRQDMYDDCILPVCQGKTYNYYVIENSTLENYIKADFEKYDSAFNCKFMWGDNGMPSYWTLSLRSDYAKKEVYVPSNFGNNDPVLLTPNTLGYSNSLEKVVFGSGFTSLTRELFTGCAQMTEVYIPYSAKDGLGDFLFPKALQSTLTVYCEGNIPNGRWNQIEGTFKYFNTVRNTPIPSYGQIMG